MKTGIIVAMDKEMALLLPHIENIRKETVNGFDIYRGKIGRHEVCVMKCGIGKVNSAIGAMSLIDSFRPSIIINTGVAGGTGGEASVMDVVLATRVAYHDVWCGPDTVPGQAAGCPRFFVCPVPEKAFEFPGVKKGLIVSGDSFIARADQLESILKLYPDAMAVDMESASIAHVCHLRSVPFVCLRVVSDTPGKVEDNMTQYDMFWENAPERTFSVLVDLINLL